jgi:hypothetical protein
MAHAPGPFPPFPSRDRHDRPGGPASHPAAQTPAQTPVQTIDPDAALARWLGQVRRDPSGEAFRRLAAAPSYGALYWAMRDAGEAVRAQALAALHQRYGGHNVPDPRAPARFSPRAIVRAAADQVGLHIFFAPADLALVADAHDPARRHAVLAWLMTYPGARPPDLCLRATEHEDALCFQAACVLGWFVRDWPSFTGEGPGGLLLLPDHTRDVHFSPMLHVFAKGLLRLEDHCPPALGCHCNAVLRLLNAPPPGHPEATGAHSLADLQRATGEAHAAQAQPPAHLGDCPPG